MRDGAPHAAAAAGGAQGGRVRAAAGDFWAGWRDVLASLPAVDAVVNVDETHLVFEEQAKKTMAVAADGGQWMEHVANRKAACTMVAAVGLLRPVGSTSFADAVPVKLPLMFVFHSADGRPAPMELPDARCTAARGSQWWCSTPARG